MSSIALQLGAPRPTEQTQNMAIVTDGMLSLSSTSVLAIPVPTQLQSLQAHTKIAPGTLIGAIAGMVAGTAVIVACLICLFCVRRRRAGPTGPILIDDDGVSKVGIEALSLPAYAHLSPFTLESTRRAPPRLAPLRVADLRPVSSQRPTSNYRDSSDYDPESPASTHQTHADTHRLISSYKPVSYHHDAPSPASTHHPTWGSQLASYKHNPTSWATSPASLHPPTPSYKPISYQPDSPSRVTSPTSPHHPKFSYNPGSYQRIGPAHRPAANYKGVSYHRAPHHRKLSYDLPPPSPLTKAALSSMDQGASFGERRAARRASTLLPTAAQRLEQQFELETARSETVYDEEEEADDKQEDLKTRAKTPTRRRPLRCRTIGSSDGHESDEMSEQHGSEYLSTETGGVPKPNTPVNTTH